MYVLEHSIHKGGGPPPSAILGRSMGFAETKNCWRKSALPSPTQRTGVL